jgi:hypothetical protein
VTCAGVLEGGARCASPAEPGTGADAQQPRCYVAPAIGRGSPPAFVRQAKLGVSCRVHVPAESGLTHHASRVLRL